MIRILSLFSSSTLKKAYQLAWTREFRKAIHNDEADDFISDMWEVK